MALCEFFLSTQFSDEILLKLIKKIIKKLKNKNKIIKYFFIRYIENNEEHIRLRLERSNNSNNFMDLIHNESLKYIRKKIIWKINTDTYHPEYERYGGDKLMILSENLFYFESKLILKSISLDDTDKYRILFAMKIISLYLVIFEISEIQKNTLFTRLKDNYNTEFSVNKVAKKILSNKYINLLPEIKELLIKNNDKNLKSITAVKDFKLELKKIKGEILVLQNYNQNVLLIYLQNHFHMFINRLFPSRQREFEVLIYNFLYKYYKSEKYYIKFHEK